MTGVEAESYELRRASANDVAGVAALLAPERSPNDVGLAAAWARLMSTETATVYIAETAGEVVGTATLLTMPHINYGCRPTAFIEAVHVAPAHRHRGVATVLLERVVADAVAAGCHKLQVVSHKRHDVDGGHALYRALGFVDEAEGFRRYLDAPIR
jgi:N-acetylglutamate synthase-like GNAT family acetyltransferase